MPDLEFEILSAKPLQYAVSPKIVFDLGIKNLTGENIQSVLLRVQIQIETPQRNYSDDEKRGLRDLFDEPERWGQTLKTLLWMHTSLTVTPFEESTVVEMPVDCTFDFSVAATKYFAALETGEFPLVFQFSGTIFYKNKEDILQVSQISWSKEARFRLPVETWREMMEMYYPNSAWLNLRRDVFELLNKYKTSRGIPTFEQALEKLLAGSEIKISASIN
jgi:hypothetical protein